MEVYKAINAVQADLSKIGITKDKKNTQQGYKFRGIDDVYDALAPILADHKLCIIPYAINRTVVERETKAGGTLFYVTVECEFHFVSAVDDSKHIAKTFGEAMDSGDKATNKAMSAAYKYAAFQTFCIPVDVVDADSSTPPEVIPKEAHYGKDAPAPTSQETKATKDDVPIHLEELAEFKTKQSGDKFFELNKLCVSKGYTPKKRIETMKPDEMDKFFSYLMGLETKKGE